MWGNLGLTLQKLGGKYNEESLDLNRSCASVYG